MTSFVYGLKWFIDWWVGLDWRIRLGIPTILITLSTMLLLFGWVWIWGWAVGGILLAFGGPTKAEKKGYRF